MNRKFANAAGVLALFSLACLGADGQNTAVVVPMRLNEAHQYFIQARINGSDPMWCSVDSGGGDRLYLDRDRAARIGIQPTERGLSAGPRDAKMAEDSRGRVTLEVAGIKFVNQTILLQSRPYADFSCVIGQTVFRQYIVEVDYLTPAIRLHDPARFLYSGPGQALPLVVEDGNPFVTVTLITPNGKSFQARVAVDTGCTALAMFSKSYVDKNDLMGQGLDPTAEPGYGYEGQQARVVSARVEKLIVGPFEMSRPGVHLYQVQGFGGSTPPDGLLCGGLLRRFKLIFDYSGQKIILEPYGRLPQ